MGWTYEITKFVKVDNGISNTYQDLFEYRGESLLKAILAMLRARKESGCVTFVWRG